MIEKRLKILQIMNTITGRVSLKEFTKMVDLQPRQVLKNMQELTKAGLLKKVGNGFSTTEMGRAAIKVLSTVPEEKGFRFYTDVDQYLGFSARSLKEFYSQVEKVEPRVLEFHVSRGDFETWVRSIFEDNFFAEKLAQLRKLEFKGERLKDEILNLARNAYSKYEELLS